MELNYRIFLSTGAMLYQNVVCVIVLLGIIQVAQACEEPEHCKKNTNFCAIRAKYREMCPCTCAADLNLIKCCENQKFEQPECRQLCTYAPQLERNVSWEKGEEGFLANPIISLITS